jgi:hypothetical protein
MINTSKVYQDYVVFVECKSLRGRSKAEYLRQVRKLAEHYPQRSLKQLTERQVFDYLIFRHDEQSRATGASETDCRRQGLWPGAAGAAKSTEDPPR